MMDPPEICTAWELTSGVHCSLEKGHEGPHNGLPSQDEIDEANYNNSLNDIELKDSGRPVP